MLCNVAMMISIIAETNSFGSILFGFLLVAIVEALRAVHCHEHQNYDCFVLICIMDYINFWMH